MKIIIHGQAVDKAQRSRYANRRHYRAVLNDLSKYSQSGQWKRGLLAKAVHYLADHRKRLARWEEAE